MIKIMVTAPSSNSGKTAVTCGLLSLLRRRGYDPCAFKCGPDYIDPMFHRSVLGIDSHNLDLFLAGERSMHDIFLSSIKDHRSAVCEGVMGYYDGYRPGSDKASAWHIASLLDMSSVLVLRPKGTALTAAALIRGIADFRKPSRIIGVIFNDCSQSFFRTYADSIEHESGIPVLGYLPHMKEAEFKSRHLGLMTAGEISNLAEKAEKIGRVMEKTVDINRLIKIASSESCNTVCAPDKYPLQSESCLTQTAKATSLMPELKENICSKSKFDRETDNDHYKSAQPSSLSRVNIRISIARDAAFCFIYDETIEAFKQAGADVIFFSPLNDDHLPHETDAIYLPGGYPELYADRLSNNKNLIRDIRNACEKGMPIIAECGGFMYLCDKIIDDKGHERNMAGIFPGTCSDTGHLVRFGYGSVSTPVNSMLIKTGESVPAHEFHHWDSTHTGEALCFTKTNNRGKWNFGYASDRLYAGYPHLYPAGNDGLIAGRFVEAALKYKSERDACLSPDKPGTGGTGGTDGTVLKKKSEAQA